MSEQQKVLLKRSSVDGKVPTSDSVDFGELAVNFTSGSGKSFLSTKKADDTFATFHEDSYYDNKIGTDELSTSAKTIIGAINEIFNEKGSSIVFSIKNTLTNCTLSNSATEITYGSEYENEITLEDSYEVKSISILMGGIDVTDTAWDSDNLKISISKVTGNIYIKGTISNGYSITYENANHVDLSNDDSSVSENDPFTTTVTAKEGYTLNGITVTMGGTDITSTAVSNNVVSIAHVTGNVKITMSVSQITFTVTQGTSDGVTCVAPSVIGYGDTLEIEVTVLDKYSVSESNITLTEGGNEKAFTYSDGKIVVENVKGNIVYSIDAAATYDITYVFNNVTSSNSAVTTNDQSVYETVLSFDTTTFNGIDIEVTMGGNDVTDSVYNKDTYTIKIENPSGDINIHAEAVTTIEKNLSTKIDLTEQDWKFNLLRSVSTETFDSAMLAKSYDDSSWDTIQIPYDWSIYGSFDTSTSGNEYESGWLGGGDAIYRTKITIPSDYDGNKIYIHFDGVYMTSEVFVNGTSVGTNKNGYIPFMFDITDYVTFGEENTIAVAVSHHLPNSRWYSGAGIYRNCWIEMHNVAPIGVEKIVVTSPNLATEKDGTVATNVNVSIENISNSNITISEMKAYIYQEWDGAQVGVNTLASQTLVASSSSTFDVEVGVSKPTLWTTWEESDNIRLYKAKVSIKYIYDGNEYLVWSDENIFGYRYISYDSTGFYLNGTKTFLKGMCNHHDNGPLGAESYHDASERQLRILKDAGCNCLRTTHAPQSSIFLDCAMRMGFMVIEELFDGWRYAKNSNTYDYARFFAADNSYIEIVVKNTIERDINNPAIIMWSLGNEVDEGCSTSFNSQYVTDGTLINTYVKNYDTTRPTTIGNNKPANTYAMQLMALVDIAGVNYGDDSEYSTLRSASSNGTSFSTKCIYGSETVSPFYTRGIYETTTGSYYYTCFDYSNTEKATSHTSWGDSSCVSLKRHMETYTWLAGTMPWTGFDYIGEPTPANNSSVRSSFFGIIDLCGFPKDAFYMYKSKWTSSPMIHIVPEDWTIWSEGSSTVVWVYSNCSDVKLHLNGTEISATATTTTGSHYAYEYSVTYEKGTLVATGYDDDGNIVAQDIRYSAGVANKIELLSDKTQVDKNGLLYVECNIEDKYGTLVPRATNTVAFTAVGGTVIATDNGFEACMEDMRNSSQSCFTGKCLAIVRPDGTSSEIVVTATSDGLTNGTITIPQGDSNIYKEETQSFIDPLNPPYRGSVNSISLSTYSLHISNGATGTVTVTKDPVNAVDLITAVSSVEGITVSVDNTTNTVTITNTIDDINGIVTIECGGFEKTVNVSCGSAVETTCSLTLNGSAYSDTNKSIYVYEYMPVVASSTGSDVASIRVGNDSIISYDSEYGTIYGKTEGSSSLIVTLENGDSFEFEITSSIWTDDSTGSGITYGGIASINSTYYLPTISTYTSATTLNGSIRCIASDTAATSVIAIMDLPVSTTLSASSTVLAEFGTDKTGVRKAYVIDYTGTAKQDLGWTLVMTDTSNGWHKINVNDGEEEFTYEYKIGTLSCTGLTVSPSVINITSDDTNNQKINYTISPEDTTDDIYWSVESGNVTCVNGQLFAIKNGTDKVTLTVGSQTAEVTVNISNITEDDTILAYNAEVTGSKQYYAGGSTGIEWNSGYTLYAELEITQITSTANLMSVGSSIGNWGGDHYHIYYPTTGNGTATSFPDTTTQGLCLAMGTSAGGLSTNFVTDTMMGGQSANVVYLVQNNNGLWINGIDATECSKVTGAFSTIQSLSTIQIGSQEGSGRFTGIIRQLRRIKVSDLVDEYQASGLTSTELEDISTNGLDTAKYLAIYANATVASAPMMLSSVNVPDYNAVTLNDILDMNIGDTKQVAIVNPHKSNGYVFGYTTKTAGYSNSAVSVSNAYGFDSVESMKEQVSEICDSENFVFTLTKTGDNKCTLSLENGYGPTGSIDSVEWSTSLMEYTISDVSTNALTSSLSICEGYDESNLIRLANTSGYYLNAQGSPASAKYATSLGEWSVWYLFEI